MREKKEECHFCRENEPAMLYNKGGRKVCSVCIKIFLEIYDDYKHKIERGEV